MRVRGWWTYSRLLRPVAGIGAMTSVRQRKGSRGKESQLPAEPHSHPTICCSDHQPESSSFLGEWTFIQPAAAPQPPGGGSGATSLHHHPPPPPHQYHQPSLCSVQHTKTRPFTTATWSNPLKSLCRFSIIQATVSTVVFYVNWTEETQSS